MSKLEIYLQEVKERIERSKNEKDFITTPLQSHASEDIPKLLEMLEITIGGLKIIKRIEQAMRDTPYVTRPMALVEYLRSELKYANEKLLKIEELVDKKHPEPLKE